MRSLRITGEDTWHLAASAPQDRRIYLDEPASPVTKAGDDVTITVTASGAALSMTCAPGREATITIVRAGEVVLKETIKL